MANPTMVAVRKVGLALLLFIFKHCLCQPNGQVKNLEYHTEEESGAGILVGNTSRDSGLYTEFQSNFHLLYFEPFKQGNEFIQYFSVDSSNGVIRTAKNIDRETICGETAECFVNLNIAVYKRSGTSDSMALHVVLQVVIYIDDINDNAPTFPRRVVNLPVPENLEVDHPLYTSVAADADALGDNSKITYRLEPSSDTFELSKVRTADGLEDLVITIKKVLDRETKDLYPLTVVAADLGKPARSGSVLINVQVTDMNDNAPVFGQMNYTVNILENSDITDPVVIVTASDRDVGENARLTYALSTQVTQEIRDMFTVESETGKIFSRKKLDFETKNIYQFFVTVSDHGSPPKSNFAYVTVRVIDVNDNPPVIQVNPAPNGDTIKEHAAVGKFLAHIKVTDLDSGVNGEVTCDIPDPHFMLEPYDDPSLGIFKIKLKQELDREEAAKRTVVFTCHDGDLRPLSASASFTVTIEDINDNPPMFVESSLYGSVIENNEETVTVMQVKALDRDEGENSRVSYALTSGDDVSLFSINQATGVISTTTSLDREVKAQYLLEVEASDNGVPRLTSTATVTINVLDENDNPPKFTRQAFFTSIEENLPAGSPVGDVSASDLDSKDNAKFKYSILEQGVGAEDAQYFTIDPVSGVLRSEVSFDREKKDKYRFRVKVADPSVANYFDIANVTVTITDANDHAPVVVSPPQSNRTFKCPFNMTVGTVVTTFTSKDDDDPNLVEITYEIEGLKVYTQSKRTPLFSIDATTGKLRIARQIRPEDVDTHMLNVVVKDGPSPSSKSSTVSISIVVEAGSPEEMRAFSAESSKTNMVIVIIIVAATIVLAFVIIAVICLIRRVDKKRHPRPSAPPAEVDTKLYQAAQWVSSMSVTNDIGPEEVRATLEVPNEKKKKKEVSFSLDDEVVESPDTSGSLGSVFSPNNTQRPDGVPFHMNSKQPEFIVMNGLSTPDYSQHLYDARKAAQDAPDERQFMEVNRQAEDRYSDASSGDTGTSDSGRGGSEDEGHGHTSSSGDGDIRKFKPGTSLSSGVGSLQTNSDSGSSSSHNRYSPQHHQAKQHPLAVPDREDIPGSPTPMLSEIDQHLQPNQHCYIRRSFDKLPTHGLGYPSGASARSSPSPTPASPNNQSNPLNTHPRHTSARLTLSNSDCEGPYRVKKAEQHQQLLKTFSSPYATGAPPSSVHPAWRRAKGLDTSWRSNLSSFRDDDDDNTTTSGSYTINPDELQEEPYSTDIMV